LVLTRSSYYYAARGESAENQELMRLLDEQYTRTPFYGVERMTGQLRRQGYVVNPKRVRRLMRVMGLEAIYPKRRLSRPASGFQRYPYLLRDLRIERPDQVWAADVTYVRLLRGYVYLVAVVDWFSRYVLAWEVSLTLEADFCIEALLQALGRGKPEIFNSDQGSQFTSTGFTDVLRSAGVMISMDGRGRVFDNIMVERLWRTVKYEEVYLKDYTTPREARRGLGEYFAFYNEERPHQSLSYATPAEVYRGERSGVGEPGQRAAVVTPVGLRPPSVTTALRMGMNPP
jgi:putative transposase